MYIALSWEAFDPADAEQVKLVVATAVGSLPFTEHLDAIDRHLLARVGPGGTGQTVVALDRLLDGLSQSRFQYVLYKGRGGDFFFHSDDLDAAHCDRIAQ